MTSGERWSEEQVAPMGGRAVLDAVGRPRLSHAHAAIRVVLRLVLAGAVVGALWAWLAPPIHIVIALTKAGDRVRGYVGDDSDLVFLGAFLMIGLLTALAVTAAVAIWQWKAHRGPVMIGALSVGALAAAGVATGVGAALVHWRYGTVDMGAAPVTPEQRVFYMLEAPAVFFGHSPLQIAASIVFPAGVAALIYAVFVLSTTRDDLDAWPPIEHPFLRPTGPVPTAAGDPLADPSSPSH